MSSNRLATRDVAKYFKDNYTSVRGFLDGLWILSRANIFFHTAHEAIRGQLWYQPVSFRASSDEHVLTFFRRQSRHLRIQRFDHQGRLGGHQRFLRGQEDRKVQDVIGPDQGHDPGFDQLVGEG